MTMVHLLQTPITNTISVNFSPDHERQESAELLAATKYLDQPAGVAPHLNRPRFSNELDTNSNARGSQAAHIAALIADPQYPNIGIIRHIACQLAKTI